MHPGRNMARLSECIAQSHRETTREGCPDQLLRVGARLILHPGAEGIVTLPNTTAQPHIPLATPQIAGPSRFRSTCLHDIPLSPWMESSPRRCRIDRKSTRLNSSHVAISYAVFCLKKISA